MVSVAEMTNRKRAKPVYPIYAWTVVGNRYGHVYAKVGDHIKIYPIDGKPPYCAVVQTVNRNKFGRMSYATDRGLVITEELLPQSYARVLPSSNPVVKPRPQRERTR